MQYAKDMGNKQISSKNNRVTGAVCNRPSCILIHGAREIQNQETRFSSCNVLRTNLEGGYGRRYGKISQKRDIAMESLAKKRMIQL